MKRIITDEVIEKYMAVPEAEREVWLEAQEWYQRLPDEPVDRTCKCGRCDGYGNLIVEGRAQQCPAILGQTMHRTREWFSLERCCDNWEGWPVPSFNQAKSHPEFKFTIPFKACQKLYEKIKEESYKQGLILCGANGRGKTWSAMILLSECAMLKKKVFAVRFGEIIEYMRRGIEGRYRLDGIMDSIRKSVVVMVDEFGKESQSGNSDLVRQAFENIIDTCYRLRTLIITSNLNLNELEEYYTPSVNSRMALQAGYCQGFEEPEGARDLRGTEIRP